MTSFIRKPRKYQDQITLFTTIISLLADSLHKKQAMLLMTNSLQNIKFQLKQNIKFQLSLKSFVAYPITIITGCLIINNHIYIIRWKALQTDSTALEFIKPTSTKQRTGKDNLPFPPCPVTNSLIMHSILNVNLKCFTIPCLQWAMSKMRPVWPMNQYSTQSNFRHKEQKDTKSANYFIHTHIKA